MYACLLVTAGFDEELISVLRPPAVAINMLRNRLRQLAVARFNLRET